MNGRSIISDDGKAIFHRFEDDVNTHENINMIFNLDPVSFLTEIHRGTDSGALWYNNPNVFKWADGSNYYFYGTSGGRLVVDRSSVKDIDYYAYSNMNDSRIFSTPEKLVNTISSLSYSKQYLICGTVKGAIHIFSNEAYRSFSHATNSYGFYNVANIQLPCMKEINDLTYDTLNHTLYIKNVVGELYKINTEKVIKELDKNPKKLLNQLLSVGITDLSPPEKRAYNILAHN